MSLLTFLKTKEIVNLIVSFFHCIHIILIFFNFINDVCFNAMVDFPEEFTKCDSFKFPGSCSFVVFDQNGLFQFQILIEPIMCVFLLLWAKSVFATGFHLTNTGVHEMLIPMFFVRICALLEKVLQ